MEVSTIDFAPVGFGSYHWIAADLNGSRRFVTVDDLDAKPWLGGTRAEVFEGLGHTYGAALALGQAGLSFVVAPMPTRVGEALGRIDPRYSLAVFPFVEGRSADFGVYDNAEERRAVAVLLAELHQTTDAVREVALQTDLDLPGRVDLEKGLREVDQPWSGGPFSEPARQSVNAHASDVAELLELFDRLREQVARSSGPHVVTHGEPHAANIIRTDQELMLIDWDTVAVAPPERDLWMVAANDAVAAASYAAATGHVPDSLAMNFYRLEWDLKDLASYLHVLRLPHRDTDDTRKAMKGVLKCVGIRDQWARMLA